MSVRTPRSLAAFNRKTLPLIDKATQGRRILSDVKRIIETDRWNSFDKFHDTTDTLVKSYEASGAKAEVYKIPTGGKIGSGRWIIPKASDIRSAFLLCKPIFQSALIKKVISAIVPPAKTGRTSRSSLAYVPHTLLINSSIQFI